MGYCTQYKLDIDCDENKFNALNVIADLRREYEEAKDALSESGGYSGGEPRWKDYEANMTDFSKKYPEILFVLSGQGESSDDKWKHYFKNGKQKILYAGMDMPSFSPEKLVDGSVVKTTAQTATTSYFLTLELNVGEEMEDDESNQYIQEMRRTFNGAQYALDDRGWWGDCREWFHHQDNLLEFSKKYPQILFVLYAESNHGSGKNDWRKYFKNGKLQLAKTYWCFPDFKDSMLQ